MNVKEVHALLQQACRVLDEAGEHAASAHVCHAMTLIAQRHGMADAGAAPGWED
jgi:hypothetical protein